MTDAPLAAESLTKAGDHGWLKTALAMIMTMREDDAARWDVEKVADLAESFSLDALGFSVGGITAFYPTEIPHHSRSPSLGGRDLAGEQIAALARRGIRSIARIDPSLAPRSLYDEHPDWFIQDATGKLVPIHNRYGACPNSGYYWEFIPRVVREILGRYDFAGLWANAAQFSPWHTGQCLCPNCNRLFREAFGTALPTENWDSAAWRDYNEWRYCRIADWNAMIRRTVQEVRPSCAWLPLSQVAESWDHTRRGGWDIDYTEPHQDGIVMEAQRRYTNIFWPGLEARYVRAMAPDKPRAVTVSYFLPWWRFYHVPVAENRVWTAQIAAAGAVPWLHLTGFFEDHFDRRGLASFREVYRHLKTNRHLWTDLPSRARVALVYSRHSLDNFGRTEADVRYLNHFRGALNAMIAQRIPFDIVSDKRLDRTDLGRYDVLVLANAACLSDAAAVALDGYVAAGGHLVTTYRTGTHTEMGEERQRNALAALAPLRPTGMIRRDMLAAYGRIRDAGHALLRGFGDTDLLPVAGDYVYLETGPDVAAGPLTLVPPIESDVGSGISVPEYNRIETVTDLPLAIELRHGNGTVLHFPWQPDLIGFRMGLADLFRLLGNAVRMAPRWRDEVTVEGPGMIDVSLVGEGERRVLHLVNFSSHGSFNSGARRMLEEIVPVHDLAVSVRCAARPAVVRLSVAGHEVPFEWVGGAAHFHIPKLAEFEQVEIAP